MVKGRGFEYLAAAGGVAVVTALCAPLYDRLSPTTVALALLLVVLFAATVWGSRPALLAAVLGVLCFNFFFLPPVRTFVIADPQNWVALVAFLVTAVTVGQLSARARRRTAEAEAGRQEIERLYQELQNAFARASQAEALRQSEQLKTALLDAVTHDLRTPLTSIKASVTILLNELKVQTTLTEESRREMLEVIDEEADRLNRLIAEMVELARIEAGALKLRRRWAAVDDLIAAALERAAPLTREHQVEVQIAEELPAVCLDAPAVVEVVYLLVDNAAKYSPPGGRIVLTAQQTAAAPGVIELAVTDEGRGVPVELREHIFEKFFRVEPERSGERRTGIGLGLAIARGIIAAHGGRLWVEDGANGRGARFCFTLPIGDEETK